MEALIHCIYASTAAAEFKERDLPALLKHIRARNARLGVTGMLLYIESSFFQVLEGPPATVPKLYETIAADPRHTRVTRIISEPIARRAFGDWTMGFEALRLDEAAAEVGGNDFFGNGSCLSQLDPGRAQKLLYAFRDGRWRTEHTGMFATPGRVA